MGRQEGATSGTASPSRSGWITTSGRRPPAICSRPRSAAPTPATRRRSRCCLRCIRWRPAADRNSCSVSRADRRTPASSVAWGRCTGRWPRRSAMRCTCQPAGATHRAERRRRDRPVRRHDRDGATRDCRSPDRDRQPDPLRANAFRRQSVPASTDAQWRGLQDQRRLRRTVLARRRLVWSIGGTGDARVGHHRRVHGHRLARGSLRDHRGADRA